MIHADHPAAPTRRRELVLGVIGGSGLYAMEGLTDTRRVEVTTPFGIPSAPLVEGHLPRADGATVRTVFVPRHGIGHRLLPAEINYRANLHALKQRGVTHVVAVSAVGSLEAEVAPGHVVLPDQFVDRTRGQRSATFFGDGVVAHVQFGEPTSQRLRAHLGAAAHDAGATVHDGGTLVVMEGPAFSTRAESALHRSWGARAIGMTALPEAKLAREAELGYALLALCTDYDCWHEEEVSVQTVMATMDHNIALARKTLLALAARLPASTDELPYPRACEGAIMTANEHIDAATRERLDLIIGHYLPT